MGSRPGSCTKPRPMTKLALGLGLLLVACAADSEDPIPPPTPAAQTAPGASPTETPDKNPPGPAKTAEQHQTNPVDTKPVVVDTKPVIESCETLASKPPQGTFTSSDSLEKEIVEVNATLNDTTNEDGSHQYEIALALSSEPNFATYNTIHAMRTKVTHHTMSARITSPKALEAPWAGTFNGGDVVSEWSECTDDGNASGMGTVSNNTETTITITKKTDTTVEGTWLLHLQGGDTVFSQGTFEAPIVKPTPVNQSVPFRCCK